MYKSYSVSEVKKVLESNIENILHITLKNGDIFILELEYELDPEIYDEDGRWYCNIVEAVSGSHPKFHKLFKSGGGLDIFENDIESIKNDKTAQVLY